VAKVSTESSQEWLRLPSRSSLPNTTDAAAAAAVKRLWSRWLRGQRNVETQGIWVPPILGPSYTGIRGEDVDELMVMVIFRRRKWAYSNLLWEVAQSWDSDQKQ